MEYSLTRRQVAQLILYIDFSLRADNNIKIPINDIAEIDHRDTTKNWHKFLPDIYTHNMIENTSRKEAINLLRADIRNSLVKFKRLMKKYKSSSLYNPKIAPNSVPFDFIYLDLLDVIYRHNSTPLAKLISEKTAKRIDHTKLSSLLSYRKTNKNLSIDSAETLLSNFIELMKLLPLTIDNEAIAPSKLKQVLSHIELEDIQRANFVNFYLLTPSLADHAYLPKRIQQLPEELQAMYKWEELFDGISEVSNYKINTIEKIIQIIEKEVGDLHSIVPQQLANKIFEDYYVPVGNNTTDVPIDFESFWLETPLYELKNPNFLQ